MATEVIKPFPYTRPESDAHYLAIKTELRGGVPPQGDTMDKLYDLIMSSSGAVAPHTHPWSAITDTPITIEGYGITDAFTQALADARYSPLGHNHDAVYSKLGHHHDTVYSKLAHHHDAVYSKLGHLHDDRYLPLSGGNISGALTILTKRVLTVDDLPIDGGSEGGPYAHTHPWSEVTATPTTLAGYGITDAFTQSMADARYAYISHTHAGMVKKVNDDLPDGSGRVVLSVPKDPGTVVKFDIPRDYGSLSPLGGFSIDETGAVNGVVATVFMTPTPEEVYLPACKVISRNYGSWSQTKNTVVLMRYAGSGRILATISQYV